MSVNVAAAVDAHLPLAPWASDVPLAAAVNDAVWPALNGTLTGSASCRRRRAHRR